MKKIILCLTVLMSIVGTGTSFGKSNIKNDRHNDKNSPKQEMVMNQKSDKQCDCKTCKDMVKKGQLVGVGRGWHKVQKKSQCNCKECQKLNMQQIGKRQVQVREGQLNHHFQTQQTTKVQPHHK